MGKTRNQELLDQIRQMAAQASAGPTSGTPVPPAALRFQSADQDDLAHEVAVSRPANAEEQAAEEQAVLARWSGGGAVPAVPAGHMRLYRGEGVRVGEEPPEWLRATPEYQATMAAAGRWFAGSCAEAEWYALDAPSGGRITYIDLSAVEADKYLVRKGDEVAKFQARGKAADRIEFFVPRDVAERARPLLSHAQAQRPGREGDERNWHERPAEVSLEKGRQLEARWSTAVAKDLAEIRARAATVEKRVRAALERAAKALEKHRQAEPREPGAIARAFGGRVRWESEWRAWEKDRGALNQRVAHLIRRGDLVHEYAKEPLAFYPTKGTDLAARKAAAREPQLADDLRTFRESKQLQVELEQRRQGGRDPERQTARERERERGPDMDI